MHFISYDRIGLSTKWTTRKQGGALVGYRVGDVDNDGVNELTIAAVLKQANVMDKMFAKASSRVVIYDLN